MRKVVIGVVVLLLVSALVGGYFYYRSVLNKNAGTQNIPVGQRSIGLNNEEDIKVETTSEYDDITISIVDKTLLSTYLNQYDFWNEDIPYYNSVNKQLITKFKPTVLILVLAADNNAQYPFKVGDMGSFNGFYDVQDQPGPLIISVFLDPGFVKSASEDDLGKRFSIVSLSAIQFYAQSLSPVSVIPLVEPPASYVQFTRGNLLSPVPVNLPSDYPEDQLPPDYAPENGNNNAPLEE